MLNICLTYDYELFLGKNNASSDEILFEPTKKLSEAMLRGGAKGTFFVDACSALAHRDEGFEDYYNKFSEQIKNLTKVGHDVQLHLHTSWYCAEKSEKQLLLTPKGYRIHEFGFDDNKQISAQRIIKETKSYIEKICMSVKPDYRCVAFRAGGFCIQPEKELIKALTDNGIVIDSSIVPHLKNADSVNFFDFSKVSNKLNWYISAEKGIATDSPEQNNSMFEVPVASVRPMLLKYIGKASSELRLPPVSIKGEYVKFKNKAPTKVNKLKQLYKRLFGYRYVSLDTRNYKAVLDDLNYIYKKYKLGKKDAYLCLICHPKLADKARIDNIENLITAINKENDKFQFVTFSDIYSDIYENKRE